MDKQIILPHLQMKKILARLKGINEADDGVDFISLSRLNLSPTDGIQIKWGTRSDTDLVNWLTVKLIGIPSEQRSTRDQYLTQLRAVLNNKNQLVCFLSGAGGTGKSEVINIMRHCCKLLYNELGIEFNKRTIVISAITGSATGSIHGETMHSSCNLNSKLGTDNVLGEGKYLTEKDLPDNLYCAAKTNLDRNVINDAIFKKVIEETHYKDLSEPPPKFTICIKASQMKKKVNGTKQTYRDMCQVLQNIVYACCGNAHVGGGRAGAQHYDPLLKLFIGCLIMITENLDVQNSMANGSMCIFKGLKLKDPQKTMECINIDGYYVNCVEADDIEYMEVELLEHKKENEPGEIKRITPQKGRSL